MSLVMEALKVEHKTMSQLLGLLEEQIGILAQAGQPDYELVKEIIDYFLTYPDLCHHPLEDLVMAKLRLRAPEAAEAVGQLEAEHERLSQQLHEFSHAVMNMMLEVEVSRETVVQLAADFIDHERKHMAQEERTFLPAALRYLTEDDWGEIEERSRRLKNPLTPTETGVRFPELRELMVL